MNYTKTPSFYNNREFFNKYLGRTSYYLGLQKTLKIILSSINPARVLELGCATGDTSIYIASQLDIRVDAVDMRNDIIEVAKENAKNYPQISFYCADMTEFIMSHSLDTWDCIYMLYSFHHIMDPLENKVVFLQHAFGNMKKSGYLVILESFLPTDTLMTKDQDIVKKWYEYRSIEGYASVFWDALEGTDAGEIRRAQEIAACSLENEKQAGELVFRRQDEYLVTIEWLRDVARKAGFTVILCEPINSLGEYALVLQK